MVRGKFECLVTSWQIIAVRDRTHVNLFNKFFPPILIYWWNVMRQKEGMREWGGPRYKGIFQKTPQKTKNKNRELSLLALSWGNNKTNKNDACLSGEFLLDVDILQPATWLHRLRSSGGGFNKVKGKHTDCQISLVFQYLCIFLPLEDGKIESWIYYKNTFLYK